MYLIPIDPIPCHFFPLLCRGTCIYIYSSCGLICTVGSRSRGPAISSRSIREMRESVHNAFTRFISAPFLLSGSIYYPSLFPKDVLTAYFARSNKIYRTFLNYPLSFLCLFPPSPLPKLVTTRSTRTADLISSQKKSQRATFKIRLPYDTRTGRNIRKSRDTA